jgi:hypothetical protein
MAEGFSVHPPAVAGYGLLCKAVYEQLGVEHNFIKDNGRAREGFDGLMSLLRGPVDSYAQASNDRIIVHATNLLNTSEELKRAAWMYTGAEETAYTNFSEDLPDRAGRKAERPVNGYKDFPNPEPFPAGSDPTSVLKPPDIEPADIKGLVDEVGGSLKVIDWIISFVTGWSPVAAITEPISGNWNSLKASGEALSKAGDALDESLSNLTKSLPQLDATWNGGAAQDFTSYITRLVEAAEQEAPLNRIIGGVYDLVAGQIEKVAKFIVERLKHVVDQILSRIATGWIPVIGQLRALDFIREAVDVFIKAKEMVDKAIELKDRAIELIEIAKDPIGHLREMGQAKLDEKLKPIEEKVEQYERGAKVASDLAELSKMDDWNSAPHGGYGTGGDPRRPGA